ncbi:PP0621 family protein [Caballeronia sp. Sq4a]|uniref:PP0621 family protein n=1 Tax=Caballeronia sp. Sq4a TaxID=2878152 RepID=UPI0020C04CA7|nr:PP0621 family protein [Caballeronia sp. Sq4a]
MRNFLLLIVLFFVTQWLLKKLRRANEREQAGTRASTNRASSTTGGAGARNGAARRDAPQLADPLIRCAQCGVHTPTSESIAVAGQRFCCAEHARRHAARPGGRDAR